MDREGLQQIAGAVHTGPCSVSQKAAEPLIPNSRNPVREMQKAFERRRDLIVGLAKEVPGFEVNVPQGAFYLFPKMRQFFGKSGATVLSKDSDDLAPVSARAAHVACVGGASFGARLYALVMPRATRIS